MAETVIQKENYEKVMKEKYRDLVKNHYEKIYFKLKSYRVQRVTERTVNLVAAFLTFQSFGFANFTEHMAKWLMDKDLKKDFMTMFHRLADFKVITIMRMKDVWVQQYRFVLTGTFLDHIGDFWK